MSFSLIRRLACVITFILGALTRAAHAQCYPNQPIRLVIGAGGPSDTNSRVITQEMGRKLGQLMIVDNTRVLTAPPLSIHYWPALAGQAKFPPPITNPLRSALTDALHNSLVYGRFATLVIMAATDTKGETLRNTIQANQARWSKGIRSRNTSMSRPATYPPEQLRRPLCPTFLP